MKFLIFNNGSAHFEMFGYIIDYCKTYNHILDIISNNENDFLLNNWYLKHFNHSFKFITDASMIGDKVSKSKEYFYDYLFLTTDDHFNNYIDSINSIHHFGYKNVICIDHSFTLRNPLVLNHIATRYYKKRNINYAYPCYNVITYKDKVDICAKETSINITIIGNSNNMCPDSDYERILNLHTNVHIYHIGRCCNPAFIKPENSNRISLYENLDYNALHEILIKTHYIYIPTYLNKNYKDDTSSGAIPLAYNYGCNIIFPEKGYKEAYKLKTPIEYSSNMDINNIIDKAVFVEKDTLINHRNNILNNIVNIENNNGKNTIIKKEIIEEKTNYKIPKKIYQTWETECKTPVLNTLIELVKKNNPQYKYSFFTNNTRRSFIKNNFSAAILSVYDKIIPGGFKADFWRYCILYTQGGIYCDIDMVCLNSFDTVIKNNIDFFCPIDLNNCDDEGSHNLCNAFIGVVPKHPIMKICIDIVVENVNNDIWWNSDKLPLEFSGPGVLGNAVNIYLNRHKRSSFIGLEGIFKNTTICIQFLKFTNEYELNTRSTYIGDKQKEFIKTYDNKYIFQNKNGNEFIKQLYEKDIKQYNIISWINYTNNNIKPYT